MNIFCVFVYVDLFLSAGVPGCDGLQVSLA